jgi:hypothetical protein
MKKNEIASRVTERELFKLSKEGKKTFIFSKLKKISTIR